jgi:hypothetical protein
VPTQLTLSNGATFIVADNVVSIAEGNPNKVNVVRFDAINSEFGHQNDDKIIVKMTNNTLDGDAGSPYLFGGASTIYGGTAHATNWASGQLKELRVNLTGDIAVLTPGLNQTGVVWSGDASVREQTLKLNKSGSYQLMDSVTLTQMSIEENSITVDGNNKEITLNATKGSQDIITVGKKNVILKNLKVTAKENAAFGTAIKLGEGGKLLNSNINLSNLNTTPSGDTGRLSSTAVSLSLWKRYCCQRQHHYRRKLCNQQQSVYRRWCRQCNHRGQHAHDRYSKTRGS